MTPALEKLQSWLPGMRDRDAAVVTKSLMDSSTLMRRLEAVSVDTDPYLIAIEQAAKMRTEEERLEFLKQAAKLSADTPRSRSRSRVGRETWTPCARPLESLREYKLYEILGQGAMGTVRRAVHTLLKREVAIKLLPPDLPQERKERALERFKREIEANGLLHHRHIVVASDAGEENGVPFLVMEYVNGMDAGRIVKNFGPLPVAEACEIIRQAAEGLQHIHERGLVHRDIKPSNLILARPTAESDAIVKILDLGLAHLETDEDSLTLAQTSLTQSGVMMGTYLYMAPEQAVNPHDVDIRADIYSLGCTLFELLTGTPPFAPKLYSTGPAMVLAHSKVPPPGLRARQPIIPAKLESVVNRMLAKSPDDRFNTPSQIAKALAPFCNGNRLTDLFNAPVAPVSDGSTRLSTPPLTPASTTLVKSSVTSRRSRRILGSLFALLGVLGTVLMVTVMVGLLNGAPPSWQGFSILGTAGAAVVPPETEAASQPAPEATDQSFETEAPEIEKSETAAAVPEPHTTEAAAPPAEESVASEPAPVAPLSPESEKVESSPAEAKPEEPVEPAKSPLPPVLTPGKSPGELWAGNSLKSPFRWCPPGAFTKGSPQEEPGRTDSEEQARVDIAQGFWLAQHEVTQAEWLQVMKTSLAEHRSGATRPDPDDRGTGDAMPMHFVSHEDGLRFCEELTRIERASGQLPESWSFRLPTEAQWEYACRAGTTTATAFGESLSSSLANFDGRYPYNGAPRGANLKALKPVGSYPPNVWGLCDMHGNVREWCLDDYSPLGFGGRVVRGGSWLSLGLGCRAADRTGLEPAHRDSTLGFRVAIVSDHP